MYVSEVHGVLGLGVKTWFFSLSVVKHRAGCGLG